MSNYIRIGNFVIEKSTGEWLPIMAGGDIFGGGGGGGSSGYSQLPDVLKSAISGEGALGDTAYHGYQYNNQNTQTAINRLLNSGNPSTWSGITDYYKSVLSPSYLDLTTNNPAIASLYNDYKENVANTQGTAYSNANKAGQFYSSYANDYVGKLTDSLTEDLTNSLGLQYTTLLGNQLTAGDQYASALSQLGALQQAGLEGSQTYYNQLLNLIQALSGSSQTNGDNSSFGSDLLGAAATIATAFI